MKWVQQYLEARPRLLNGHVHDGMWMTAPGLLRTDGKNGKNGAEFKFVMECIREFGGEKLQTLTKYTQLRTIWFEGNDPSLVGSMHNLFANAETAALESLNKRRRTDVSDKVAAQLRTDLTLDDSVSFKIAQAKHFASQMQTRYSQISVVPDQVMYAYLCAVKDFVWGL